MKFELLDADGAGSYDWLGGGETTMNSIMTNQNLEWNGTLSRTIKKPKKGNSNKGFGGYIRVQGEFVVESHTNAYF